MQTTLALNAALGIATAILYLVVGRIVARRPTTTEQGAKALRSFAMWWTALAASSGLGSLQQLLAGFGILHVPIHVAFSYVGIPILMLALAGLLQYLVYIHTGSLRWHTFILGAHAFVGATYFVVIAWLRPIRVHTTDWNVTIDYARGVPSWFIAYAVLTILVPVIVASLAYFTLAFRTRARLARFRILTVSGAFLLWFGSAGVASAAGWSRAVEDGGWYWWPLAARAIGLASTLLILFAYRPPGELEKRLQHKDEEQDLRGPGGPHQWRLAVTLKLKRAPSAS